jgi:hypothetical protein
VATAAPAPRPWGGREVNPQWAFSESRGSEGFVHLYMLGDVRERPLRVPLLPMARHATPPAGSLASQAHTRRGDPGLLARVRCPGFHLRTASGILQVIL